MAYAAGIITGSCGPNYVFEMPDTKINDKQFKIIINALLANSKIKGVTLKFPINNLTNSSLEAIATAIKDPAFPPYVTIDLSGSTKFTDAGAAALLAALSDKKCNLSFHIKLPENPRMVNAEIMKELNEKITDNNKHYQPEPEVTKSKKKMGLGGIFTKKAAKVTKNKSAESKTKDKKAYTRLNSN